MVKKHKHFRKKMHIIYIISYVCECLCAYIYILWAHWYKPLRNEPRGEKYTYSLLHLGLST